MTKSKPHRAGCSCEPCQERRASSLAITLPQGYPAPRPKNPRPKKPKLLPLTEFPSREHWEEGIFRTAAGFNVVRFGVPSGSESMTFGTFPEALKGFNEKPRSLMYCFNRDGNAFCLVKTDFAKYQKLWEELHA